MSRQLSGVWPEEPSSDFGDVFDRAKRKQSWAEVVGKHLAWIRQAQPDDWEALRPQDCVRMRNILWMEAGPDDWKAFSPEQQRWLKDALGTEGGDTDCVG